MLELDLSSVPTLTTERLMLRPLTLADGPRLHALRADPRTMEHLGRPRSSSLAEAEELIRRMESDRSRNEGIGWAITRKDAPMLVGTIGFYRMKPEHHRAEVGYLLDPDEWGQGLMGEALNAVVTYGFEQYRFHSIEAITDPKNSRSRRVLERTGFVLEGLFRENHLHHGVYLDSAVYSRLSSMRN